MIRVQLNSKRQITFPKECEEILNTKGYRDFEVVINDTEILLRPIDYLQTEPEKKKPNIKVVANYLDAPKYSVTKFSDCGLVVRTKARYINQFCDVCRGKLATEYEKHCEGHFKCPYLTTNYKTVYINPSVSLKAETDTLEIESKAEKIQVDKISKITTKMCHNGFTPCGAVKTISNSNAIRHCNTSCKGVKKDSTYTSKCPLHIEQSNKDVQHNRKDVEEKINNKDVININNMRLASKEMIAKMTQNYHQISDKLDDEIIKIDTKTELKKKEIKKESKLNIPKIKKSRKQRESNADTIIEPFVPADGISKCKCCGELFEKGFLVDNIFMCKECAIKDIKSYIKKVAEQRKRGK